MPLNTLLRHLLREPRQEDHYHTFADSQEPSNYPPLRSNQAQPEQHPPKTLPSYYARSRGITKPPERLVKKQESAMCYYQRIWWGCGCYFGVVLLRRCEHRNTPRCQRRHLLDRWHLATYCPHHRDPPLQLTCSPDNSDDGNRRRRRRRRRRHRSHRSQDQRPGSRGGTASAAETGDSGEENSSSASE
ncbi:hypothetical protein VTG60DRAFT_2995 [Thermothelomyces hinnuleus]